MGRIKAERGELDVAEKLCIDALHIRFELFEILGTPEAKRNVALSLDSVGGIAGMRGALDAAEKLTADRCSWYGNCWRLSEHRKLTLI